MRIQVLLIITLLLLAAGCFDTVRETPSAIVAYAEAHGSGDLQLASAVSIQLWAHEHKPLAEQIYGMCKAQASPDATWADTTEGRLCLAVRRQAFYGFMDRTQATR